MGTCQSCGRDGEEVAAVQRVYLLPPPDGAGGAPEDRVRVEDDVEYWCWSCREHFPHVLLVAGTDDDGGA